MKKRNILKYMAVGLLLFFIFIVSTNAQRSSGISMLVSFEILGKKVTCTSYPKTMDIMNKVFRYVRIAAVVLFVVLSSADYASAIMSDEKDGFKKTNGKLIKRLIVLIAILILPSIVSLLLKIIQLNNGNCFIE